MLFGLTLPIVLLLGACSDATDSSTATGEHAPNNSAAPPAAFDPATVHTVAIDIKPEDLTQQLSTYAGSGDKSWAAATVTLDGAQFPNAGIKLKGNLSLKGTDASSDPAELSWLIRLDKYAKTQSADGYAGFIIRGNSTATSLNEAAALDLLRDAGLASEYAVATRFSVNRGEATLRLMMQDLDERWVGDNFPDAGSGSILYKSDGDGDWSWRGSDGDYTTAFKVKAGPKDYAPLIALLDLLNHGSAAEIAEKLPTMLDLDSFVTYQAFEHIIDNFDDISGPGNNSYLFYDAATRRFTVVAWDHNLAFGVVPMPGGGGGMPPGMTPPKHSGSDAIGAGETTSGAIGPAGAPGPGDFQIDSGFAACMADPPGKDVTHKNIPRGMECMFRGQNPLVDAVYANPAWAKAIDAAETSLRAKLLTGGPLEHTLTRWTKLLETGSSDLVTPAQINADARPIRAYISG